MKAPKNTTELKAAIEAHDMEIDWLEGEIAQMQQKQEVLSEELEAMKETCTHVYDSGHSAFMKWHHTVRCDICGYIHQ